MADGSVSTLTNPVTGTGTTNYVPKWTSGSAIGNSQIFDNGTNVGVGTATPAALLNVAGGNIMISNTVAAGAPIGGLIFKQTNSSGFDVAQIQAIAGATVVEGILTMSTKDSGGSMVERMRITSGGNVLIGTTTDSGEELVVNGNIGIPFSAQIRVAGGGYTRNDIFQTGYNNISDLKDFLILEAPGSSNGKIVLGTGSYANVGIRNNTPQSALDILAQGNTAGGTMMLSGSKTNNAVKYGVITTAQYASDTETEGVGLIGGTNTSTENIVNIGGGVDELNTATSIRFFAAANTTTRGSANERMRVNAANDAGNLYIGTTSTNDYGRLIVNGFSGAWLPYIAGTSLSYNQFGIVVGSANMGNTNIGGGLTLVNNNASVGAYGPVVSWSSMTAGGAYNSTYAFITGVYGGQGGDTNWAIGDILFGTAATYGAEERMRIRYNGNVLIGTTTDSGYKLRVNGTIYADSTITSATSVRAVEGYFNPYTSAGNIATPVYQDAIFLGPLDNDCTIQFGNEFQSTHGSYIRFRTNSASAPNTPVNVMTMFPNGKVALNQYGAGTFTSGTVAYNLGVDSAGNVMELPGGVVDGSGTANKVSKWSDANTLTDANITDNGTTVRINSLPLMADSRLAVGTAGGDQTYANVFIGGNLTEGSSQYALLLDPQLDGTTNYGMLSNARIAATHAATTAYGIYQLNNELLSGASVVNNYGIYIANQTSGTTQNWNLYSVTGKNYFGGNVLIGTTTDSGEKLVVLGTSLFRGATTVKGNNITNTFIDTANSDYSYSFQNYSSQFRLFNDTVGATVINFAANRQVQINAYGSGTFTGTAAYNLAVDSSGNIIETLSPTLALSLYDLLPAGRVAYNWVGQVVNDTWVDIFSKSDNILTTGTWMVQMYVSDFGVGGGHYTVTYQGSMQWYQDATNQSGEAAASEIFLQRMGHAANASILYLRTLETTSATGSQLGRLQIKANYSNTSNQTIAFKFVKIF
jgi:hypothetical protein